MIRLVCAWMVVAATCSVALCDSTALTREELISKLAANIKLAPQGIAGHSQDQQQALLERLQGEARNRATRLFPAGGSARTPGRLASITSATFYVSDGDLTRNLVFVEKWLLDIRLGFERDRVIDPLPADTINAARANVRELRRLVQASVERRVGKLFAAGEIQMRLDAVETRWLRVADGDSMSTVLRKPLAPEGLVAIADEFDKRLASSSARASARLDEATGYASRFPTAERQNAYRAAVTEALLHEIVEPPFSVLANRTRDEKLAGIDLDVLVPGYRQAARKAMDVRRDRMRERIAGEEARFAGEARREALRAMVEQFDRNVVDMHVSDLGSTSGGSNAVHGD